MDPWNSATNEMGVAIENLDTAFHAVLYQVNARLRALEESIRPSSTAPPATTATATPSADTQADRWDAQEQESTTRTEKTSLPSGTRTDDAGPAAKPYECAHEWGFSRIWIPDAVLAHGKPWPTNLYCRKCRASRLFVLTPAPAVAPITSTSVKQDLSASAAHWPAVSARYASTRFREDRERPLYCCTDHFGQPHPGPDAGGPATSHEEARE